MAVFICGFYVTFALFVKFGKYKGVECLYNLVQFYLIVLYEKKIKSIAWTMGVLEADVGLFEPRWPLFLWVIYTSNTAKAFIIS